MLELRTKCYVKEPNTDNYYISAQHNDLYQLIYMQTDGNYRVLFQSNQLIFFKLMVDQENILYAIGKQPGLIAKHTYHLLIINKHLYHQIPLEDFDIVSVCLYKEGSLFIATTHGVYEYSYKTDLIIPIEIPATYLVQDLIYDGSSLYGIAHLEEDPLRKPDGYVFKYCPYTEEFNSVLLCQSDIKLTHIKKRYETLYIYGKDNCKEIMYAVDHHLDIHWSHPILSEKNTVP